MVVSFTEDGGRRDFSAEIVENAEICRTRWRRRAVLPALGKRPRTARVCEKLVAGMELNKVRRPRETHRR